ncbi:CYTH domain-containing protein [Rheinheimera sp.]|uniref:CYTH domain-containing protein n=1 Tax=Rheinheimera sp. TaxID=1869214 RepID=UPI00235459CB|nr:CYTH domain-containing protein [Rheinheimera sp.]
MSTELELKFLLAPAYLPQLQASLTQLGQISHYEQADLLNAYFDTSTNWFRQHDMGLRSRLKKGLYEQTIKLAGTQHGAMQMRPEYNEPCASVIPQLVSFPSYIWPENADVGKLQAELTELFRTDFNRSSWQLRCADGTEVDLVYDQGQVVAKGKTQPIAELELELLTGDPQQLFVLASQLIQLLPLQTGWLSKAARGYQLAFDTRLKLPTDIGDSLLAQVKALQQAEACYLQQRDLLALGIAAKALSAIASATGKLGQLQQLSVTASALAQQLAANQPVFALQEYNLLLLSLSQYLYQHA